MYDITDDERTRRTRHTKRGGLPFQAVRTCAIGVSSVPQHMPPEAPEKTASSNEVALNAKLLNQWRRSATVPIYASKQSLCRCLWGTLRVRQFRSEVLSFCLRNWVIAPVFPALSQQDLA